MRIKFVEVQNFRKLKSVRIDFSDRITLCVGANNSGKTSAMIALSRFFVRPKNFTTNDFTLSNWATFNKIGAAWETNPPKEIELSLRTAEWEAILPTLDLWLEVGETEIHYVRDLLPSLDWTGGQLGVRLRFEPKDLKVLSKTYLAVRKAANDAKTAAADKKPVGKTYDVNLWPENLRTFLARGRNLSNAFEIRFYLLDPTKRVISKDSSAKPQKLPPEAEPLEKDPLKGLIRIDEIPAQRGFGEALVDTLNEDDDGGGQSTGRRLSEQLKGYYKRHLDPTIFPEPADLDALQAIENAQDAYNDRLESGFFEALNELKGLNYPGVTDPRLKIATRLRPSDGLNHSAAVQYDVLPPGLTNDAGSMLPEDHNGLGYQNLISMVFKLMGFRDAWMRVGKAGKVVEETTEEILLPPIHLVLIEEPEAYLHAQVQQVFLRRAYDVLRKHKDLGDIKTLTTQLIVSTHSSHIAHESEFSSLRYFRRLPATPSGEVPTSLVVNQSEVFGPEDETRKFWKRYIRAAHCDLFFADAAILVEGPAERMLVPHFIRTEFKDKLHCCYISILEIGGSHAFRLRELIEHLGLTTLVISDLDAVDGAGEHPACPPKRNAAQITANSTLKFWHPEKTTIDDLLAVANDDRVKKYPDAKLFAVRVAYQMPVSIPFGAPAKEEEVLATTFEDALVLENVSLFKGINVTTGPFKKIKGVLDVAANPAELSEKLFDFVSKLDKAAFALELLWLKDPCELKAPAYIKDGLKWLEDQLVDRQNDGPRIAAVVAGVAV